MRRQILITGELGFIGGRLVKKLIDTLNYEMLSWYFLQISERKFGENYLKFAFYRAFRNSKLL
ncbi:MAG: hypothetical protein A2W71_00100 [Candidatus Nealsonbacteria bacterium RIFCSPLOWO2_02_39_8]|uniref:Uncharacterized protein n=1 Tax=Candidatus Nealsonbacteria bacterium RIFCSPLOWO2_02_39_8 TaxID=1801674 RepID=A0A1G2EG91_9BACT|nr:MAG: hypothetical protein US88_C0016G0028 [Parcubacteria group bacterium GW2011_GWA2_38_27]OGZ20888.1 MAG: hypothetical protein A2W55_02965 [Candidatus Nealsonbacteria bacterium RIFCSPHIGHO2_02_38_10]OGZ22629.1 MAG: hypothetical protein A3E18_02395 [Candidatus Nealsonbacteria bacterium RIFCSPHIGHO2_12_FULL_38_18]OGZ24360.1 MAG: hypothetical protein A2W71_00100 [Candidatus Nealsonbacteria bacterium RIFCSPLOWO2_02_39_8]